MRETAYRVVVSGMVTGVGFRYCARREAQRHGLQGFVRNLDSRTVECVVQGMPEHMGEMLAWLRRGPETARVHQCTVAEQPCDPRLVDFRITR